MLSAERTGAAPSQLTEATIGPLSDFKLYYISGFGFTPSRVAFLAQGSLSPRSDWRAPTDAEAEAWLRELRENIPET